MAELLELTMRALDEETRRVFAGFGMLFAPVATPELLSLVLEFDVKAVSQALRTLERRGLAEQEPRTEERAERYSIDEAGFAYAATLTHAGDKYRALAACLDYVDRYKYKRSFFRLHAEMANLMGAAGWALRNGLYDEVRALADDLYRGPAPNSELGFFDLQGYFGPAADLMEMAAEAAHSQRDKLARAGYTGNMGSALRDMGHYDRAARVYGRARTLFRRIENRHGEGISLARLGIVDAMRGRPQDAYQTLTDALDVVREVGDKRWEAIVLNSLGSVHRELFSDFDELEVIEYHREALIIAIEIRDRRIEGTSLQKLGTVYRIMRDSEKAISYLERALDIAREVRDKQAESTSLGNLGLTFRDRGEYRKALNYLNKSLQISREIGSKHGEGIDLGGLGTVYEKMGELERAKHYYQLSLDVERSLRNWRGKAINLRRLGDICRRQDMLGAAVDYYEEALAVARRYDDPLGIVINLSRLGDAHHKLGNHDVALSYLEEAVQRRHEDGAEDDANWQAADLVTLGQVRRDLGEFESALDSLRAARDISAEMGLTGTVQDLNRDIIALKKVVGDGRRPTAGILMPDGETDEEQERFIFMSYAREDTVIMRRLRDALVRRGLNVWTDEQLEPGLPSWQREIERVIPTAGAVIALFSPDAKVSEWVNEELNFAVIHGVRIFPVLVRGSERTSVPFGHSRRQYVDFRDDSFFETSIEQISEALRNHMRL
jgi:tetratricopeptide (TPR) repeat protein